MSAKMPTSARSQVPPIGALFAGLLVLVCGGCGGRAGLAPRSTDTGGTNGSGGGPATSTGGAGTGGTPGSGGMNAGGANTGGAGSTPAGTGGAASPVDPPLVNVSGRWGMFGFEDPVGVQLVQAADGTLTGRGCVAGAPGGARTNMPLAFPEWCGEVTGEVRGRTASFGFTFLAGTETRYATRVTVSDDARRMTGTFSTAASNPGIPIGWLPVADDSNRLPFNSVAQRAAAFGAYQLALVAAETVGTEFVAGRLYLLHYSIDFIGGDLGMFWQSEMTTVGTAIRVGPVPPTAPELAVSLSLELTPDAISRVTATTASGGRYTFTATRRP